MDTPTRVHTGPVLGAPRQVVDMTYGTCLSHEWLKLIREEVGEIHAFELPDELAVELMDDDMKVDEAFNLVGIRASVKRWLQELDRDLFKKEARKRHLAFIGRHCIRRGGRLGDCYDGPKFLEYIHKAQDLLLIMKSDCQLLSYINNPFHYHRVSAGEPPRFTHVRMPSNLNYQLRSLDDLLTTEEYTDDGTISNTKEKSDNTLESDNTYLESDNTYLESDNTLESDNAYLESDNTLETNILMSDD
ncbi:hypothetical protein GNI_121780, partial [Gregarina niphandrodes]